MKKFMLFLAVIISAGLFISLNSCTKDDLTEQERLELLDSLNNASIVQYSVNVISAADAGIMKSGKEIKGLKGAIVTVNHAGNLVSITTNDYGTAVFKDMRGGNASITIHADGFTDVTLVANLTPDANQNQNYTFASTIVPLFPLSGEWMTDITGIVTYQSDLTNNALEKAEGVTVTATLDINDDFMDTFFPTNEGPGYVVQISYSSVLMKTTTNADGEYTLTVPAAAQGLDILIDVAEVALDQKIVLNTLNGEDVFGVQNIRTIFGNNTISPTSIPDIPGAYITIGAPTGAIGSYTQQAFISPVVVNGQVTSISITNPGSGYTADPSVIITGDGTGASATATRGPGGVITGIAMNNYGAGYTWANATLYLTTYRENAVATPMITDGGAISNIVLQNSGEGYIVPPVVSVNSQVSGVGSGATAAIYQNNIGGGGISSISITNGGSNYKQHSNYPLTAENSNIPTTGLSVKLYSGKPIIRDLYLGTGKRTITN
jgi:hypothetical protein